MASESTSAVPRKRRMVPLLTVVLIAVLIILLGFTHIVHGGNARFAMCAKDGWALGDTFVDLDDYIGEPLLSKIEKAKVVRAMFACHLLEPPAALAPAHESRVSQMFGQSKLDTTRIKLNSYAYEAYPSWSAAHPDKACPDKLAELNEYMTSIDANDSWGRPIKMLCGAQLPAGAKGIGVMSWGEDGREGTEDDLRSWE